MSATRRFHFIGICGTAMATLAAMLKARGHDVQGSDYAIYPPMSDFLARESIRVLDGYRAEHITPEIDVVVVGNAISRGNPELEEVLDRKIRFVSLPEAFGTTSCGRPLGRHHGHPRQDDDDCPDRMDPDDGGATPPGWRHRRNSSSYPSAAAATSSSRATSTTAPSSTRPRSS
jgi:hypothetical protein